MPTAARFILECQKRGIRPCWDAANKISLHMAQKLGYEYNGEYSTVYISKEKEKNLYTKRLILRPWMESDAESLYEYAKDPEVGPIAGWPVHTSVENSREIIGNVLAVPETCEEITRHAFEDMKLENLWCGYFDGNEKSKRAQEKCHFTYHHTDKNIYWALMDDVCTEHITCLTKEIWNTKKCLLQFRV
ncbi:MAG: GNAT family N-acetyltransferase [Clostridiales bacterium]|nr:GNAT family N-acetyltransferase [Clostridiales bacterium]